MSHPEARLSSLARATAFGLALSAAHLLSGTLSAQVKSSTLHTEGHSSAPIVESPQAMEVTSIIQCFCGTCVNQTLHECTCGLAASERAKVAASLASGATPESLIAAYIAEHGPQVRIVPERRGLNLVGWLVPFAAALAGLLALVIVLRGWRRRALATERSEAALPSPSTAEADRSYRLRLERDLKELER